MSGPKQHRDRTARLREWCERLPSTRPWTLILTALVLAVAGGAAYGWGIEIRSNRHELSNPDSPHNRRVARYRELFEAGDQLLLVVSPTTPEQGACERPPGPAMRARMKRVARAWAERVRARPDLYPEVEAGSAPSETGPFGLLYLDRDDLETVVQALRDGLSAARPWLAAPSLASLFELLAARLEGLPQSPSMHGEQTAVGLHLAESLFGWMRARLAGETPTTGLGATLLRGLSFGEVDAEGFPFVAGGRALVVTATVRGDPHARNEYAEVIEFGRRALRAALDEALDDAPDDGPPVFAGLAGLPALEYDEVAISERDFGRGAALALTLVSLLFCVAFSSIQRPVLAAVCLGLSILITFLFTWIVVGSLNLLTMVFAVILVALGVDFAIHFATHYESALHRSRDAAAAVQDTLHHIGGALWIGGLTTAAAFVSAAVTEAAGLAQLGLVAGGGLVICMLVMVTVYPAMLFVFDRRRAPLAPPRSPPPPPRPIGAHGLPLAAGTLALAALGFAAGEYRFDTDLLALQPVDGPSVRWQRFAFEVDGRTRFAIATYPDRASLENARTALSASPLVRATLSVFPEDEEHKRAVLAPLCAELTALEVGEDSVPDPRAMRRALFGLRQAVRRLSAAAPEAGVALATLSEHLDGSYRALREASPEAARARIGAAQNELVRVVHDAVDGLRSASCPPPFDVARAPPALRRHLVGRNGEFALLVYPVENTWQRDARERFVAAVSAIEPDLFGGVVAFHHNAAVMVTSFLEASVYAVVAVLVIVLVWCRSLVWTALSLLPLVASVGLLLGTMRLAPWWLGADLAWNFGNFFALPILIGVGADSGIHLARAWRDGVATFAGARRAVVISTLTTLTGFGVLATSDHLGVRSLGTILSLGIAWVLLTATLVLPPLLARFAPRGDAA